MRIGVSVSSTGIQSEPSLLLAGVKAAEQAGFADIWMQERIAIAPDDSQSGGGRCLDPLATLAWLAGQTQQIGLGMSALILPYRPPLLTAKTVATLQELSGNRLRLGVGVGWMESEFRVLPSCSARIVTCRSEVLPVFRVKRGKERQTARTDATR